MAPRQGAAPAAIIGYSGLLAGPEYLEDEVVAHPPVTLIHGELDAIVSFREMEAAAKALRAAGVSVSTHLARGAGHTITPEGASWGLRAIRRPSRRMSWQIELHQLNRLGTLPGGGSNRRVVPPG